MMTDKEQIIIDGVDVSRCIYFRPGSALTCTHMFGGACDNKYSDELCYFKQLARKTQECEELKEKIKIYSEAFDNPEFRVALTDIQTGERDIRMQRDERLTKENVRYRKSLEEIEKELVKYQAFILGKPITQRENDCLYKILDIISKAKDGK